MKFCYVDESGTGDEQNLVVAAVAVDSSRMHVTKAAWGNLFDDLSQLAGRDLRELKSRELYRGNGPWRHVDGTQRAEAIKTILDWLATRHHDVFFSAVDKTVFEAARQRDDHLNDLRDPWCAAVFHVLLQFQKAWQAKQIPKGHYAVICDAQDHHRDHFLELVQAPPSWVGQYSDQDGQGGMLSWLVDVPYFADSEHILLIQVADLLAYVLHRHAELASSAQGESYEGETVRFREWAGQIADIASPSSVRWKRRGRNAAEDSFYSVAPECMRGL